jgi:hypothetical protein
VSGTTLDELAQAALAAYIESATGQTLLLPQSWDMQAEGVRNDWRNVAGAIASRLADPTAAQPAAEIARLRGQALAAVDKFESYLGFTAPELIGMRIEQLRGMVSDVFEVGDADAGSLSAEPQPAAEIARLRAAHEAEIAGLTGQRDRVSDTADRLRGQLRAVKAIADRHALGDSRENILAQAVLDQIAEGEL